LICQPFVIIPAKITIAPRNLASVPFFRKFAHVLFPEPGCGRLDSSSAITVPLTTLRRNADLLQLLLDLRSQRVLPGWREAVIINDVEAGDEIIDVFGEGFSSQGENLPTITQPIYNVDSMSLKSAFSDQLENILAKYQKY
jgi:hypothetical protein